jgi:hypothetical protein
MTVPINPGPIFPDDMGPYTTVGTPNDSAASVDTSEFHGIERAHLTYMFPDQLIHLDTTELTYGPGQGLSDQQQNLMALRHKTGLPLPPDIMDQAFAETVQPNLLTDAGQPSTVYSSND